jgi:hypothetical protein
LVIGGIDKLKGDADVIARLVARNLLSVKMAGRSFGGKKYYGLIVTVSSGWKKPVQFFLGGRGANEMATPYFGPQFFLHKTTTAGRNNHQQEERQW